MRKTPRNVDNVEDEFSTTITTDLSWHLAKQKLKIISFLRDDLTRLHL